jgi:hypothetical protein
MFDALVQVRESRQVFAVKIVPGKTTPLRKIASIHARWSVRRSIRRIRAASGALF